MRRLLQSVLLLALCASCLAWLGALYVVFTIIATGAAIASGVIITYAVALGFVWPVLAVAYVTFVLSATRTKLSHRGFATSTGHAHAVLPGVEQPQHREHRDQT